MVISSLEYEEYATSILVLIEALQYVLACVFSFVSCLFPPATASRNIPEGPFYPYVGCLWFQLLESGTLVLSRWVVFGYSDP